MTLDRSLWYVRWFFWSLEIWGEFREGWMGSHENQTNLCFFIRTTLVSAPLTILLHLFVYSCAIASVTYLPITLFGGKGYLYTLVVIALIIGLIFARGVYEKKERSRRYERLKNESVRPPVLQKSVPSQPSFLIVMWQWLVAQKKKVCPTISFADFKEVA